MVVFKKLAWLNHYYTQRGHCIDSVNTVRTLLIRWNQREL
jgi:hypothetical protein